ncbi:ATP-binding cassette domain-containing protein [Shewanella surugensis]|uniref:ATP-binding cassette domain-containing protein n=1 Tax=Shewanella surugensis TaxID=212020 RepID=A0ABT0LH67_9GAMM|nr:ATP-binding cassette domain-containing protein [Shewanella surugensis]MCL1127042.1 ATP-binding cassette domain-containing protein [Shewanella surugensis]
MTTFVSLQSVSLNLHTSLLLNNISLSVTKGDRIGLVGHNGSGKSSLLKLINEELTADTGNITYQNQCILAKVEQTLPTKLLEKSLFDAVLDKLAAHKQVDEQWRVEMLLNSIGLTCLIWGQSVSSLSGGQYNRLLLARALILEPDLLLLDEPSNHMDLPALLWLETFLQTFKGSFILVSHDQRLLDKVTNQTWIIHSKNLHHFTLSATKAAIALATQLETDKTRHQQQQQEIDRIKSSAKRLAHWGHTYDNQDLSRKAKMMQKRADKLVHAQVEKAQLPPWTLRLNGQHLQADRLLTIDQFEVRAHTGGERLYPVQNLQIRSGDHIAILGANGCGKSSLIKQLWNTHQDKNSAQVTEIQFHQRCTLGYYDQHMQQLDDEVSLIDALYPFYPSSELERKQALIISGFHYVNHQSKVRTLSGGERSRLLFTALSLAKYAFLLLDEPTNHLDVEGKEQLATSLSTFEGGFILVSHDREIIEKSCNRYWLIQDGKLTNWIDIDALYDAMRTSGLALPAAPTTQQAIKNTTLASDSDDMMLTQLIALETQLALDLKRKTKHQKPKMQQQWQQAIRQLESQLSLREHQQATSVATGNNHE